jgi:CRP/FNR family transcriptional regulator, cyclic AMP receptor protein
MVSKRVYIDHLRDVSLFRGFSRKDLERVAGAGDTITVPKGHEVMHEGVPGKDAFVVLNGQVSVKRGGRTIARLGEGAIVGELSLLDRGARTATVVCDTDCTLLVLSHGAMLAAVDDVPALSRKLFTSLAARIRDLDGRSYV